MAKTAWGEEYDEKVMRGYFWRYKFIEIGIGFLIFLFGLGLYFLNKILSHAEKVVVLNIVMVILYSIAGVVVTTAIVIMWFKWNKDMAIEKAVDIRKNVRRRERE